MGSDFLQKAMVSGIAFTALAAVLMMGIAYIGYSSDVMHSNLRRIMTGGLFIICVIGAVAAGLIYFPNEMSGFVATVRAWLSIR